MTGPVTTTSLILPETRQEDPTVRDAGPGLLARPFKSSKFIEDEGPEWRELDYIVEVGEPPATFCEFFQQYDWNVYRESLHLTTQVGTLTLHTALFYFLFFSFLGNTEKEKFIKPVSEMEEKKKKNVQHCGHGEIAKRDGRTGGREEQEENSSKTIEIIKLSSETFHQNLLNALLKLL